MNKLILYTDGSFKNNVENDPTLGCYGAGAHGYVFNKESEDKPTTDVPTNYIITDSGYIMSADKREDTKLVTPIHYIDASYSFLNKGTISRAELLAIRCTIDSVMENIDILQVDEIEIWADSTYAIGVVSKILEVKNWVDTIPNTTPNYDIIKELENTLIFNTILKGITIKINKVQAHSVFIGNNLADGLAYYARNQSGCRNPESNFNIFTIEKGKKYWGYELEQNELIKFKQLFFTNSLRAQHTEIIYAVMNYKTDVEPGTRTHDALMGLVSLSNPPEIIEDSIRTFHRGLATNSVLSTVDLKNLYSREVAYHYSLYGNKIFDFKFKTRELLKNRVSIVKQIPSPGLGMKLLMDMQFMYGFIKLYREYKNQFTDDNKIVEPNRNICYVDITDRLYEKVTISKKKEKNT